ncbi:MAG: hypothetical protein RhofKO_00550 [Rhodothermales bacterium]
MKKRFNILSMCSAIVLAGMLFSIPVFAQDGEDENTVVIEVDEDGTVTVNGEVVEGDGTVTIKSKYGGGNETVRVFSRNGNGLSSNFKRIQRSNEGRLLRRLEREAGQSNGNVYVYRGDDDEEARSRFERLYSGNGNSFWFSDDDSELTFDVDDDAFPFGVLAGRPNGALFTQQQGMLKGRMEIMKLEREAMELAQQARRASGDERAQLEADLDAQLDAIFERKMELRQAEIDTLEKRLTEERAAYQKRTAERKRMIERRKKELLGERDDLDW